MSENYPHVQGITALWLTTGKKLEATKGFLLAEKGVLVRISDTGFFTIPTGAVVAIEAFTSSKEELDKVFNGSNTAETET